MNCERCQIRSFYRRYPGLIPETNGHPPCQTPGINPQMPLLREMAEHVQKRHNDGNENYCVADLVDFFRALVGEKAAYTTIHSLKLYENRKHFLLLLARGRKEKKPVEYLACFWNLDGANPGGTLYTLDKNQSGQRLANRQKLVPLDHLRSTLRLSHLRAAIDLDLVVQQDQITEKALICPIISSPKIASGAAGAYTNI